MTAERRAALAAGIFFLITEVAAIAGLMLYGPVLDDRGYALGGGADGRVQLGALFEMVLAVAIIGTGVALYPVLRRRFEGAALGYVCGRLLEAAVILVGAVAVLSVVTLRQDIADGAAAGSGEQVAGALVAVHDWTFLFGPGVVLGLNSIVLAYMMFRTGLVPRPIAVLGLVGGSLITVSAVAVMYDVYEQTSAIGYLMALPVFAWEVAVALWMVLKGFRPMPAAAERQPAASPAPVAA
jgi:hypothetical protein